MATASADASARRPANRRRLLIGIAGAVLLAGAVIAVGVLRGSARTSGLPVTRPADLVVDAWREKDPPFKVHIEGHVVTRFDSMFADSKYDKGIAATLSDEDLDGLWKVVRDHRFDRIDTTIEPTNKTGYAVELSFADRSLSYHRHADTGQGSLVVNASSRGDYDAVYSAAVALFDHARNRPASSPAAAQPSSGPDPWTATPPTSPVPEPTISPPTVVEAPVRRQLTPIGLPFSVAIPQSAQVSPRDSGKGPTRHADIDPGGLGVDLIEWDTGPDACKPDVSIPGTHTERNDYRTTDRTSVLYYKHDTEGDYGGHVCNGTVGYTCIFDHVPQARSAAALAVCLSVERIGATAAAPTTTTPTTSVASATASACTIAALNCNQFSTRGQTGKKLHALVFAAEQAGRHAEAICLARSNLTSGDKWLAGAANFDSSRAWDGLGCHDQAVAAIEASLAVRPRDQGGWKETCEQCRKIGGTCAPCNDNSASHAGSNSRAPVGASNPVERSETGSNGGNVSPVWVSLVQDPPSVFEVWEAGTKVTEGPGAVQVVLGHPRTIVIKGRGWKDKTLVVDGKTDRVEFKLELAPDCNATLADPKNVECRTQYCANHKDDPKCGLE